MSEPSPITRQLVELMGAAPRGPRQEGFFALWLTVRVLEDFERVDPISDRAGRRRAVLLQRRLSSLTLNPGLRRSLGSVITVMAGGEGPPDIPALFAQLVGPAREALGPEAGDALQRRARSRK
jgi:hypothetical protein